MRQKLLDLHEIQEIDLEIREFERGRAALAQRLAHHEEDISRIKTEVGSLTEQREAVIREIKTLEGTVHAESLKIRKWETRLNEIRNQREYLALSREVEGLKRANREAEEKTLELMVQRDTIDRQLDQLQDQLAVDEVDCDSERGSVTREMKDLEQRIANATGRRETLVPKIPTPLLKKYEAIREKRLGQGLVPVIDGCCQGCNMKLPPQLYNVLQRGDSIEQCPSCQRLIFWERLLHPEDLPAKAAEASP